MTSKCKISAFTLIEIAIVLVVIGLIVGGVLVGRDLINAASVRSQIAQIEKYQQATNTFRGKYGYLPGDIRDPDASNFGFVARNVCTTSGSSGTTGLGDGNGMLQGVTSCSSGSADSQYNGSGEMVVFWRDLATAKLVDGGFDSATMASLPSNISATQIVNYMPISKLNPDSVVSIGNCNLGNYFTISQMIPGAVAMDSGMINTQDTSIKVSQAFGIDTKTDDGFPGTGNVLATRVPFNLSGLCYFAWPDGTITTSLSTSSRAGSATTCFDNNSTAGVAKTYSITQNSGNARNCPLSIKMQ